MHRTATTRFRILLLAAVLGSVILPAQTVRPIDAKGLTALISERKGKVLLLNIWATWCVPCREEFPDLVTLSNNLRGTNAEVVAVSVDYPDEVSDKILPFVKKMKTPFRVYVADFPSQDDFINSFDKEWSGAVPVTFIYDAKGKQRKYLLGKRSYAELKKAVDDVTGKQ